MSNCIIDLSAVFWHHWHIAEEISGAKRRTVNLIHDISTRHEKTFVAIDSPPYKRCDILSDYKANRGDKEPLAVECLKDVINSLDGCVLCRSQGYEADDVIAKMVGDDIELTVYAVDKDILQCADIVDPWSGKTKTPEEYMGVSRDKVLDFLTLTGDKSDNIKGVHGVGKVSAKKLIDKYGGVSGVYSALMQDPESFKPSARKALLDAQIYIDKSMEVIKLQTEIAVGQREIKKKIEEMPTSEQTVQSDQIVSVQPQAVQRRIDTTYQQALEPVGLEELWRTSRALYDSRLYTAFGTPQAIMACIMKGRALGIDAVTSLDSINVIKGKPTMSASLMVALVLNSPKCEYFYCAELSNETCTWIGKRVGNPEPQKRTFTIEDAKRMGLAGRDNWIKQPDVMLQWRCATALARQMFPDVIAGLYAVEEME